MSVMKQKLFFLCVLFSVTEMCSMKRQQTRPLKTRVHKKQKIKAADEITYSFDLLPEDMQNIVIDFSTINTTVTTIKDAAYNIRVLPCINKKLNMLINNKKFSDRIIKAFSQTFSCSHEKVAEHLHTHHAKKRLRLQGKLTQICDGTITYKNPEEILKLLIRRGADLNFTIDYQGIEKTPLMITLKNNFTIFKLLLKNGAPLNTQDSRGLTVLNIATEYSIEPNYLDLLLSNQHIMIDQRNNQGETALLHCLINRAISPLTSVFRSSIKKLLKAGADPELADNSGYTPLAAAETLEVEKTIDLIKKAIKKKYVQQHSKSN